MLYNIAIDVTCALVKPEAVSAWNVGNALAPLLVKTCVAVPGPAAAWKGPVAVVPANTTLYAVAVERPVPPFATFNVPAKVTAPDVAELGVKPVVPAVNGVTPAAGSA